MPEHVIPIDDGHTAEIVVECNAYRGAVRLTPHYKPAGLEIRDANGMWLAETVLRSDPARAAVLEERERCKAAVSANLSSEQCIKAIHRAIDAIDAPAEPSEFERGGEAFRELVKSRVYDWPCTDLCHDPAIKWLNGLPGVTEPTP